MKKTLILITFILLFPLLAAGQSTFSVTYAKPETFGGIGFDMVQLNNHIFVCIAELLYFPDDESWEYNHKILKYDPQGNLVQSIKVPAYVNRLESGQILDKNLVRVSDSSLIYLTETPERDGTSIFLIDFDLKKTYIGSYRSKDPTAESYFREHRGAHIADGSIYLYSFIYNPDWGSVNRRGQILRICLESKEIIWEKIITPEFNVQDILNFQSYIDGDLIFQVNINSGGAGPGTISKSLFYVINGDGVIQDVFELNHFLDIPILVSYFFAGEKGRFVSDENGNIIFHENRNLWTNFTKYGQHINSFNPFSGKYQWSFTPPNNVHALRHHFPHEIKKLEDGNVLIVGRVIDNSDNQLSGPGSINDGFILKFDPRGVLLWYRLIKHPNHKFMPKEEFGWFKEGYFRRTTQLDDGRFAVLGYKNLNLDQWLEIDPLTDIVGEIWLLVLDENGCYDGQKCQSIIRIDYPEFIEPPVFPIGTKWTYDYSPTADNPNHTIYSYITYEVTDSFTRNDTLIYVVENNRGLPAELMIQDEYKVWFWDEYINDWQMTYNFRSFIDYSTRLLYNGQTEEVVYKIDTIDQGIYFGERDLEISQVGHFTLNGDIISEEQRILEGLGRMNGGLRLPFYGTPNGDNPKIGDIRCFEQGDFFFNFKPIFNQIKCDSVWIDTGTSVQDVDKKDKLVIYPNPSSGDFYLEPTIESLFYQVIDNKGKVVDEGRVVNSIIPQQAAGHYLLKLWKDGNKQTFQLISIKE